MAEVAISKSLFAEILRMIVKLRPPPVASTGWKAAKRDAFELKLTGDVRYCRAGLDGVHRATAVPDASSASGRYETGNSLEKIANTGQIGRRRRRHPANVSCYQWLAVNTPRFDLPLLRSRRPSPRRTSRSPYWEAVFAELQPV